MVLIIISTDIGVIMNITPVSQNFTNFASRKLKQPNKNPAALPSPQAKYTDKALLGIAVASACFGMASTNVYNDYQNEQLIQDMMQEYKHDDTKSLKIEDLNKDNTPEIIIEKKDGAKVVYDIKNNDISFDIDGDKIEKIR